MLLAIDTATRWLGLALHDGEAILAEVGWRSINTQTVDLTPAIADMFAQTMVSAADLKGVGVAIGPGSYTGLRVGLGVAKGISLAHRLPLVGIPTLDIVAAGIGELPGQLIVIAEAGRSRICAGRYAWKGRRGWQPDATSEILSWDELLSAVEAPVSFAGEIDAEAARHIRRTNRAFRILQPGSSVRRAGHLAQLAWDRVRKGQADDAAGLAPIYLRDPAGNPVGNPGKLRAST
jgi:tRNA threonylcarbamoyladenosine biosynthesis protein TsaB